LLRQSDRRSVDRLSDLFRNLGNSLELEEILATLDQELRRLIIYQTLQVFLLADEGLIGAYGAGTTSNPESWIEHGPAKDALTRAARDRRPAVHRFDDEKGGSGSVLFFPVESLADPTGPATAILVFQRAGESTFTTDDQVILREVSPKLAASITNARKYRRVEQLAETDPLTGVANVRSLFQRLDAELARARRARNPVAVFQCSVEGLDHSGQLCSLSASRSAFEKIALKLRDSCREYDFTARSGDDLVLVLPGFRREFLAEKCSIIRNIVEETGLSAGFPLFASVGAAFFPQDGIDAEDLLAMATERVNIARQLASPDAAGID